jgi:hypothetical protein
MLANFTIARHFNNLRATLVVDCTRKEASISLTYNRRLRECRDIPYHEVSTPDIAEAWLSRTSITAPEHGNMLEAIEHQYRNKWGIGA